MAGEIKRGFDSGEPDPSEPDFSLVGRVGDAVDALRSRKELQAMASEEMIGDQPNFPEPVLIRTADFEAEMLPLYELPGMRVISVVTMENGMTQMKSLIDLFRLSVVDPSTDSEIDLLSFQALTEAVMQWVTKSNSRAVGESPFGL